MTALLTPYQIDEARGLWRDGWDTSRAMQTPQIDLVLVRDGGALPMQPVVAVYPARQSRPQRGVANAETQADIVFRRLIDDGFDVEVGDRFRLADGETGEIVRTLQRNGLIFAEATLDVGVI